jgi:hypothetical protein
VHDDFRADPSRLYRGGGALDHPCNQRIKHQYRDGLDRPRRGDGLCNAVKVVNQRGFTQIAKKDDVKYFLEGTRKGKNATLQVIPVGSNQSRVIITIENDKDATGINEAVEGLVQTCRQLGFRCEEQKA